MCVAGSATSSSTRTSPSSPFLVGVDDDHAKWLSRPDGLVAKYRDLGLEGVRVTISWRLGQRKPTPLQGHLPPSRGLARGPGAARRARRLRPARTGSARRRRSPGVLRLRRARPHTHPVPGRGDLERGQLAAVLAASGRRVGVRGAARDLLADPARAEAGQRQRHLDHLRALRPGRVHARGRARLCGAKEALPDRRHLRPQPVPESRRRAAVGAARRSANGRPRRSRSLSPGALGRVRGNEPTGAGRGPHDRLVPGDGLPDDRPAREAALLPRRGDR